MPELSDAERYVMLKGFVANQISRAPKPEDSTSFDNGHLSALNLVQVYIDQLDKD